nr:S-methyl-5-thioribose-1-phosphate isomerase [Rhizobiaceae bacterium]
MKVDGKHFRTIWPNADGQSVDIIDQRWLPHEFRIVTLSTLEEAATAIADMWVRGAPLIGVTAAYGMALAMGRDASDAALDAAWETLHCTRPTAINLKWALDRMRAHLRPLAPAGRAQAAWALSAEMADEDVAINRAIGENGLAIIRDIAARKRPGEAVNILTHCNAGWLATGDYGT